MVERGHLWKSAIILIALLSMAPGGCGSGGLASVSGSVTYQGKPAKGASVHFRREGETPEEGANYPIGIVDEEGHFDLEVAGVGWGAIPGRYKVLVRWPPESKDVAAAPVATKNNKRKQAGFAPSAAELRRDPKSSSDRLKFRYFNPEKPLLFAEIKPGTNKLDPFELKD
jgi:hypothetical protein